MTVTERTFGPVLDDTYERLEFSVPSLLVLLVTSSGSPGLIPDWVGRGWRPGLSDRKGSESGL